MTLTEFVTARLDEDEAIARAAIEIAPLPWQKIYDEDGDDRWLDLRGGGGASVVETESGANGPGLEVAEHISRHDPARVLREVEAKRQIIAHHVQVEADRGEPTGCAVCHTGNDGWTEGSGLCGTVLLLAAIYADHPGYREEWRP